jgi:replication factor C subunit 1
VLLGRELGFTVVEVNASDTRNKADAKTAAGIAGKTSNAVKELVRRGAELAVWGLWVAQGGGRRLG